MSAQHQMESRKSLKGASINSVKVLGVKTSQKARGAPRVLKDEAAGKSQAHNSPILSVTESFFYALIYLRVNHSGETLSCNNQ